MTVFQSRQGFTFLELIIAVTIITVLSMSFFMLLSSVLRFVQFKKIQTEAASLATEQMEIIRNLPYNDVGTIGGVPTGTISQLQLISKGDTDYTVRTDIRYVDDDYDGLLGGNPNDLLNTDYKQIKITISWNTAFGAGSMFFLNYISPKGVETTDQGGTLRLTVFNASGAPVPQANIDIINTATGVSILNLKTNDNGLVLLPGTPEDIDGYEITVDKALYSLARTYGLDDPVGNILPMPIHLSVFEGTTTESSFAIDKISQLIITTQTDQGEQPPVPFSAVFIINGSKIVGQYDSGDPIYKYKETLNTDVGGSITINSLEWDSYMIEFDEQTLGKNLISYSPPTNPINVLPDSSNSITFTFSISYNQYTLLVTLTDENSVPLENASVTVMYPNTGPSYTYNSSLATDINGQVFFNDLFTGDFKIEVIKTGYDTITNGDLNIDGNNKELLQMSLAG